MAESENPLVARLRAAGVIPEPAVPALNAGTGIVTAPGDPAGEKYAAAALERECGSVARAPEGTRNDTLNKAGYNLGQLVGAGHLIRAGVIERLTAAALSAGLTTDEVRATVTRSVDDGTEHPREVRLAAVPDEVRPAYTLHVEERDAAPGSIVPTESTDGAEDPFGERYRPGGAFIFDAITDELAVWGDGADVLWASGEALMIVGPPGVGKTTVAQQLTLARAGFHTEMLGYPVVHTRSKVLYLAMDRPRQIARSMRRMVDEGDRELLDERLVVWPGPPPADVAKAPETLRMLAEKAGADTIVIDSVKDAAIGLTDSEVAGWYNRARQRALAAGVEVLEVAHQVKKGTGGAAPKTLADVHGGMELTAGVGSVFLVWGDAGDLVVEFRHLKQPSDVVGPFKLIHDHIAGATSVFSDQDPVTVLKNKPNREWSPKDVALVLTDQAKATDAEVERVRRRLAAAADRGVIERRQVPSTRSPSGYEARFLMVDLTGGTSWEP